MLEQQAHEASQPALDQIEQIKSQLTNYSQTIFCEFIHKLNQFPTEQVHLKTAFMRLDEGMFWFREAIAAAVVKTTPLGEPQVITPPDAPVNPSVNAVVDTPLHATEDELPPTA